MAELAALGGNPVAPDGMRINWPVIGEEEKAAVLRTLEKKEWCRLLPDDMSEVTQFEREWAQYHDAGRCIAVANGTVALMCAYWALGVKPGDEVIVPAVTFIATADAAALCCAVPVFADVEPDTYQISARAVESAITARTKAIAVVHYGGYPCDLDSIKAVAEKHDLPVVEDCAHAQGTEWRGRKVGAQMTAGCFSFQQSKSLTAGEGGAVITDDPDLAERVWAVHNCGRPSGVGRYDHHTVGGNFRLGEWQGAILRAQLKRLPEQTRSRMENGRWLSDHLKQIGGLTPLKEDSRVTQRGYYFHILRYDSEAWGGVHRNVFVEAMRAEGVRIGAGYGEPVYKAATYAESGVVHRAMPCPNAERICADEQLTVPTHALLERANMQIFLDASVKLRANLDDLHRFAEMKNVG